MKKFFFAIAIVALFAGCATKNYEVSYSKANPYEILFTTNLDINDDPTDNVKEITLNQKRVYFYIKWHLPLEDRVHTIKIYDGSGRVVYNSPYSFTPVTSNWYTWTWYDIKKDVDQPGNWKFEVYSKGKLLIQKYLKVS